MPMDIGPQRPRPFIKKGNRPGLFCSVELRRAGRPRFNGNRGEVVCSVSSLPEDPR